MRNKGVTYSARMESAAYKYYRREKVARTEGEMTRNLGNILVWVDSEYDEKGKIVKVTYRSGNGKVYEFIRDDANVYRNGSPMPLGMTDNNCYGKISIPDYTLPFLSHQLKYFIFNPEGFELYMNDKTLVINHMITDERAVNSGTRCALGYRKYTRCAPSAEGELVDNLELIPQSFNRIHGDFIARLGLYNLRVSAYDIVRIDKYILDKYSWYEDEVCDAVYERVSKFSHYTKQDIVKTALNRT